MKKQPICFLLYLSLLISFCSGPPKNTTFFDVQNGRLPDSRLPALYIPLEKITLSMVPDKDLASLKKANPIYLFAKKPLTPPSTLKNDLFFIEMANTLALNEISQHYTVLSNKHDTNETLQKNGTTIPLQVRWSPLSHDTGSSEKVGSFVKNIAEKYRVDLVIIPYECSLRETETQPGAWRNNKYGKYYDKPSTVDAKALFHVQIWDKNGRLLYERKGTGVSRRPAFYEALKQTQPRNQSLVDYSKNIFAPTIVRALGGACRKAFIADK
jgi:hypothetical protein